MNKAQIKRLCCSEIEEFLQTLDAEVLQLSDPKDAARLESVLDELQREFEKRGSKGADLDYLG